MKIFKNLLCIFIIAVLLAGCNKGANNFETMTNIETDVGETVESSDANLGKHVILEDGTECVVLKDGSYLIIDENSVTVPTVNASEQVDAIAFFENVPKQDMSYGADVQNALSNLGFSEIHLYRNTDRNSLTMYISDDAVQGTVKLSGENTLWNYRMEKADNMIPRIALPAQLMAWDNGGIELDGENSWYVVETLNEEFFHLQMAFFPATNNLYTFWTNLSSEWEDVGRSPITLCQYWEGDEIFSDTDYRMTMDELVNGYNGSDIVKFRLNVNGDKNEYQAKFGATLGEWANSELNTAGWHFSQYNNAIVLSPDEKYYVMADDMAEETISAKPYNAEIPEQEGLPKYKDRNVYCVNSNSNLHVAGFTAKSKVNANDNFTQYSYSGMSPYYSANDIITVSGCGTTQEFVEGMEIYVLPSNGNRNELPYNNDVDSIRKAGTKLTAEYVHNDTHVEGTLYIEFFYENMFKAEYKPQNDPHFRYGSKVDICFIYNNEVVYWMFLPQLS